MNILFCSPYFPPEMGAPSARTSELGRYWVRMGHQVTALTGFPNQPTGVVPPEYRKKMWRLIMREDFEGIRVERTWLAPFPNRKPWERILNYSSYMASAAIRGTFLPRHDVVIATSPQLLTALAGWWIARVKGVPFVFEVRDLWPESLTATLGKAEGSWMHRIVGRIASFLYRHSDHIVVVTPAFRTYLAEHWKVPLEKISVVVNGVETELFRPTGPAGEAEAIREQFGLGDRFIVSFIGTIGNAHGLGTVVEAAQRMQQVHRDALFLLVGDGAEREKVERMAAETGLTNLRFTGPQPRRLIAPLIRASDVCLVLLKRSDVFKTVIPTKMLEFMSCARPFVLGVEGQAQEIAERAGTGLCIPPEDVDALVTAIDRLYTDPVLREEFGRKGRDYVVRYMSREQTARDYIDVLEKVVAAPAPVRIAAEAGKQS
jgi:colanic acid biosynthesis glycosyl transferase WcaI